MSRLYRTLGGLWRTATADRWLLGILGLAIWETFKYLSAVGNPWVYSLILGALIVLILGQSEGGFTGHLVYTVIFGLGLWSAWFYYLGAALSAWMVLGRFLPGPPRPRWFF